MAVYKISFATLAETEIIDAYNFYEDKQKNLGERFLTTIQTSINSIKLNPFIYQRKYKHFREAFVKKFPYFLVYEIIGDTIVVVSVFHTSKNPKYKTS
ncbi:MAG: type II toxin-antitoxin system RelE/ParE family toxin [Bacteroidota bacterium]